MNYEFRIRNEELRISNNEFSIPKNINPDYIRDSILDSHD